MFFETYEDEYGKMWPKCKVCGCDTNSAHEAGRRRRKWEEGGRDEGGRKGSNSRGIRVIRDKRVLQFQRPEQAAPNLTLGTLSPVKHRA